MKQISYLCLIGFLLIVSCKNKTINKIQSNIQRVELRYTLPFKYRYIKLDSNVYFRSKVALKVEVQINNLGDKKQRFIFSNLENNNFNLEYYLECSSGIFASNNSLKLFAYPFDLRSLNYNTKYDIEPLDSVIVTLSTKFIDLQKPVNLTQLKSLANNLNIELCTTSKYKELNNSFTKDKFDVYISPIFILDDE